MSKYAIPINENSLELIQVLNGGGDVAVEDKSTYFVFETDITDTKNTDIIAEDDLYDEKGSTKDPNLTWVSIV